MLRSRPHESGYFWTAYFGLLSSRIRWKWSPKTHLFKNALRNGGKKNAGRQLVYLQMDRYDDLINQFTSYTTLALHMLYKGFCGAFFITWAVSCRQRINVDGRKRFEYATFGRLFLWNGTGGKKSPFSKSIRTGLDGVSLAADAVVHPSHVPVSFFLFFWAWKQ